MSRYMNKPYLQNYFDNPHREGYCRWIDGNKCYYIPVKDMKRILLEELESVKFKVVVDV